MALIVKDRVQQTGTANTTVSFTLSGAVTGFQSFTVIGDTNTTYYSATDTSGNWEVGLGTYSTTGPTLTRTTILSSSNSGSAVTFSGTVNVFVTYPSDKALLGTTGAVASTGTGSVVLASNPTLTGYTETVYAVVDAVGVPLSPNNGTIQTWTLGASRTPTAGTWDAGQSLTLMINDGTAFTVTWTTLAVTWVGGTAPTLATTGFTVLELWKVSSTIYGAYVGTVA